MKLVLIALALLVLWTGTASATECANSRKIVAACFWVHGRLFAANGAPGVRIWIVGTKRILGVLDGNGDGEGEDLISRSIVDLLSPSHERQNHVVFGDYEVCPLSRRHVGWMQMVCLKDARHLVAAER